MAGPSSPPFPSLPWQPAQRLTKDLRPVSGGWANAIEAGHNTHSKSRKMAAKTA